MIGGTYASNKQYPERAVRTRGTTNSLHHVQTIVLLESRTHLSNMLSSHVFCSAFPAQVVVDAWNLPRSTCRFGFGLLVVSSESESFRGRSFLDVEAPTAGEELLEVEVEDVPEEKQKAILFLLLLSSSLSSERAVPLL